MDFESKQEIESLKFQMEQLENQEKQLKQELEQINNKKAALLAEIGKKSDEKYEQDMLELVYKQRKNLK